MIAIYIAIYENIITRIIIIEIHEAKYDIKQQQKKL